MSHLAIIVVHVSQRFDIIAEWRKEWVMGRRVPDPKAPPAECQFLKKPGG